MWQTRAILPSTRHGNLEHTSDTRNPTRTRQPQGGTYYIQHKKVTETKTDAVKTRYLDHIEQIIRVRAPTNKMSLTITFH